MLPVGSKIAYPMYGAGIVEGVEEKEILGERRLYYILRFCIDDLQVMVPVTNEQKVGLRCICGEEELEEVLRLLQEPWEPVSDNWTHRYRENFERMKSGVLLDVARVYKELCGLDHKKSLSTGDRKMMGTAQRILVSEIALVKDIPLEDAERVLSDAV